MQVVYGVYRVAGGNKKKRMLGMLAQLDAAKVKEMIVAVSIIR